MHIYIYLYTRIYIYKCIYKIIFYQTLNPSRHTHTRKRAPPKTRDNFARNFAHYPVFIKKRGNDVAVPASAGLQRTCHPEAVRRATSFSRFYEKGKSAKLSAKFLLLFGKPMSECVCVCGYH